MPHIGSAEILAEESDASEYCWGEGYEDPHRYRGLTEPCENTVNVGRGQ